MMTLREFIDAFQRCTSHGWLDWDEALLLASYAEMTSGTIVEFGSYKGRSASLLCQLVERVQANEVDPNSSPFEYIPFYRKVVCVDPWETGFHSDETGDQVYRAFINNLLDLPNGIGSNIAVCRCRVEDWHPTKAGIVYCDGDHSQTGTRAQISKAIQCGPDYIAMHDVCDSGGGLEVKMAALSMLGPWLERINKMTIWKGPFMPLV